MGAGARGINQRGWREPLLEDPRGDEGERKRSLEAMRQETEEREERGVGGV